MDRKTTTAGCRIAGRAGKAAGAILLVLLLGLGSAWVMTSDKWVRFEMRNGPWEGTRWMGRSDAGPYLKAYIARIAWFGLPAEESVYFIAKTDSDGRPLDPACAYVVSGGAIDTRWWSITVYKDLHWIRNPQNRYSYSKSSLGDEAQTAWELHVSETPGGRHWLPSSTAPGDLSFVLRLYNPSPALLAEPASAAFPRITRGNCK